VVAELDARYSDLGVSFADCSIDEGHFRAVAPRQGGSFLAAACGFLTEVLHPEGTIGTAPGGFGNFGQKFPKRHISGHIDAHRWWRAPVRRP
jgi:hypothetical protein